MDAKAILEQLLNSAKEMSLEGKNLAEEKLDIPKAGSERDAMLSGMGKGALAAGALAILLGTGTGRRVTGTAVKFGGLAALGTLAYKAFKNWQGGATPDIRDFGSPIGELASDQAQSRSEVLLETMIAAAKADGHIDAQELANIERQIDQLGLETDENRFLRSQLAKPIDVNLLAAKADSREAAAEMYLVSRLIIDLDNDMERRHLKNLASALGLAPELVAELERQIVQA